MSLDFTAIDCETGNNAICSIGAVKVRDGKIGETFSSLVDTNNGAYTNVYEIRKNGGITADMVAGLGEWPVIYQNFMDFIGNDILVAHGASFDRSHVKDANNRYHLANPDNQWFCTQIFYDNAYPEHKEMRYKYQQKSDLRSASRVVLGHDLEKHHNALADAVTAAKVAIALSQRIGGIDLPDSDSYARITIEAIEKQKASLLYQQEMEDAGIPDWIAETLTSHHEIKPSEAIKIPDGERAEYGAPCLACGTPIPQGTNYRLLQKQVCSKECGDRLLSQIKDWWLRYPTVYIRLQKAVIGSISQ